MGVYATIQVDDREGQVKLWPEASYDLATFTVDDKVPRWGGLETYSIAMREGGFVNVHDRVITGWTDHAEWDIIADKYGDPYTKDSLGLLGEEYLR